VGPWVALSDQSRSTLNGPGEQDVGFFLADDLPNTLDTLRLGDDVVERDDEQASLNAAIHTAREARQRVGAKDMLSHGSESNGRAVDITPGNRLASDNVLEGVAGDSRSAGQLVGGIQVFAYKPRSEAFISHFPGRNRGYRTRRQQTAKQIEDLAFAIFRSRTPQDDSFGLSQLGSVSKRGCAGDLLNEGYLLVGIVIAAEYAFDQTLQQWDVKEQLVEWIMVEPPTLKDVAASMLGVMWFEGRRTILCEPDEAGHAVDPCRYFGEEVLAAEHCAHLVDHAIDARLAELDDAFFTISGTVVWVHGTP
jgi:hypothetical protein